LLLPLSGDLSITLSDVLLPEVTMNRCVTELANGRATATLKNWRVTCTEEEQTYR
jgi:hypothetical protein